MSGGKYVRWRLQHGHMSGEGTEVVGTSVPVYPVRTPPYAGESKKGGGLSTSVCVCVWGGGGTNTSVYFFFFINTYRYAIFF